MKVAPTSLREHKADKTQAVGMKKIITKHPKHKITERLYLETQQVKQNRKWTTLVVAVLHIQLYIVHKIEHQIENWKGLHN